MSKEKSKRENPTTPRGMDFDEVMLRVARVKPDKSKKRAKRKSK